MKANPGTGLCGKLPKPALRWENAERRCCEYLGTAAGHWGSCAEYLRETVFRLEEIGIHDASLWHLQELVAERIEGEKAKPKVDLRTRQR